MNKHFLPQLSDAASMAKKAIRKATQLHRQPIEPSTMACTIMDAFAQQLTEVRNLDTEDNYKKQLDQLEVEYQFVLLRSLHFCHKEMGRSNLLERLHHIKKQLCDTNQGYPAYPTNLPFTDVNENLKTCRHCKRDTLRLRLFSNELCCENCGLLEPLDGVAFNYNEIYHCGGDHKVVKR